MRDIHARPSPLPVLFLFCLYFVSACSYFFILACLCPFFHYFFLRMKNSNRQIRRFHAYVTNTASHSKISNRKIPVNCLKEKLKTLLHMIVFLKHDQLIQTEGLIENFTHALNFANCYVESRQCQTLYDTCTYPIMHLIPPTTPPAQICMTFVFHFSWVSQPSQEKLKTMLTQNFGGK